MIMETPAENPAPLKRKTSFIIPALMAGALFLLLLLLAAARYTLIHQESAQQTSGWSRYMHGRDVIDIAIDANGNVWTTCNQTSVCDVNGRTVQASISGMITAIAFDRQNQLWIGTFHGEIAARNSRGEWKIYTPKSPILDDNDQGFMMIHQLAADGQGRVWAETHQGLTVIAPGQQQATYEIIGQAYDFFVDSQGAIWLSDANGFYNPDMNDNSPYDRGASGSVFAMDSQGQIWFYYNNDNANEYFGKLARLDKKGNLVVNLNAPFESSGHIVSINTIAVDKQDQIWVGTDDGLFRLDTAGNWTAFNESNSGLPSNWVKKVLMDPQGQVWVATYKGLSMIDPHIQIAQQNETRSAWFASLIYIYIPIAMFLIAFALGMPIAFILFPHHRWLETGLHFVLGFASFYLINLTSLWLLGKWAEAMGVTGSSAMILICPMALMALLNMLAVAFLFGKSQTRRAAFGVFWGILLFVLLLLMSLIVLQQSQIQI